MPLLNKRSYQKAEPFRDATIFIVVCEGSEREPKYFDFFDLLTKKIKVIAVPSEKGHSSPEKLIPKAHEAVSLHNSDEGDYELWFVIDVDRWRNHLHDIQREARKNNWNVAISNPCFEVWLNNHFESPSTPEKPEQCKYWKPHISQQYGGFDTSKHPTWLERAIATSKSDYSEEGYIPDVAKTQVFRLGERLFELAKDALKKFF